MMEKFSHIDTWIFDLDNTLYPAKVNLFGQVDTRMRQFISRTLGVDLQEAQGIQKHYFETYGTTLRGLMDHHHVAPLDFLNFVHDVDMDALEPDATLATTLQALPGRKLVFTNADGAYAERVLQRLGLSHSFDAVHCIIAGDMVPKPQKPAYDKLIAAHNITPHTSVFFEDVAINLVPAKALGMTTVWIETGEPWSGPAVDAQAIDHRIPTLTPWLTAMMTSSALTNL